MFSFAFTPNQGKWASFNDAHTEGLTICWKTSLGLVIHVQKSGPRLQFWFVLKWQWCCSNFSSILAMYLPAIETGDTLHIFITITTQTKTYPGEATLPLLKWYYLLVSLFGMLSFVVNSQGSVVEGLQEAKLSKFICLLNFLHSKVLNH